MTYPTTASALACPAESPARHASTLEVTLDPYDDDQLIIGCRDTSCGYHHHVSQNWAAANLRD